MAGDLTVIPDAPGGHFGSRHVLESSAVISENHGRVKGLARGTRRPLWAASVFQRMRLSKDVPKSRSEKEHSCFKAVTSGNRRERLPMSYYALYRRFSDETLSTIPLPHAPGQRTIVVNADNPSRYLGHTVIVLYGFGVPRRCFFWSVFNVQNVLTPKRGPPQLKGHCEDLFPPYEFDTANLQTFRDLNRLWGATSFALNELKTSNSLFDTIVSLISNANRRYNHKRAQAFSEAWLEHVTRIDRRNKIIKSIENAGYFDARNLEDARRRVEADIIRRQGQQQFREKLLSAYNHKCAVTRCDAEDALEAAHIHEYLGPKTNHVQNGILLRADIHTLFDRRLLSIDPTTWKVVLNKRLALSAYSSLAGKRVLLPTTRTQMPHAAMMRRHCSETLSNGVEFVVG